MSGLEEKLAAIELPMLILHGSADGLALPEGSKMLHEKISSSDKKRIIYEGLYHEIFNEPEQEDVMSDIAEWLAPHLVSPAQS
jgi:alpha-beta hydrolase superfamily lysophospholipase